MADVDGDGVVGFAVILVLPDLQLSPEMLPFERKLNTVKRTLAERKAETALAEQRKDIRPFDQVSILYPTPHIVLINLGLSMLSPSFSRR